MRLLTVSPTRPRQLLPFVAAQWLFLPLLPCDADVRPFCHVVSGVQTFRSHAPVCLRGT
eukprot:NODE_17825_length_924_cov_3.047679.p7 GENE.NODE_17825_length_924_cov_3.047679~~NODE_17825_length_924_cov_3.047679.p7  ORF type:complete len:59 (+),score=6.28 NODE_17825_length_924_cov_3.047679:541-717(+)